MQWYGFVDEVKAPGYAMVAVRCSDAHRAAATGVVRSLLLPNQRRLHMRDETRNRKLKVASAVSDLADLGVSAEVFDASRRFRRDLDARSACLRALVGWAAAGRWRPIDLILEKDQTLVSRDRQDLLMAVREFAAPENGISYCHETSHNEMLLCLADVVAWCWSHQSSWRQKVAALVADVTPVSP